MILEQVIGHAVSHPNSVAIIDDKRTLTYRELVYGSSLMVDHLRTLAPTEKFGDKVGLLIPPSSAFVVGFGATRWDSRIALPMNYLLKPAELAAIIADAGLKVVVTIEFFKPMTEAITAELATLGLPAPFFIVIDTLKFERPGLLTMAELAANPASLPKHIHPVPARAPDDVAIIMYTSGTSGVPKGVMLTNANLESNARDSVTHCRFTEKTVFLGLLPMFHTLGLQANCLIPLMLGCKIIYQARFSPVGVFEACAKHQCEVLVTVPTMFSVLAAAKSAKPESLKTIKYAIAGGEPLPVSLIHLFKEKFDLTLMEGFGLTETSPIIAISVPWAHKIGSVGKLIPEVQARLVDDNGADLPLTSDGELWLKGPMIMKGYYNKPEMTAEVLTPDGWFKTGDVARFDADGYLYITGRKKDMIIMAGEKVFPREIEDALKQHPAVVVAAVLGIKDEARGEAPIAFVQLRPEIPADQKPTENELRAFVRERIAPYKTPRNIYFMDELPRSGTGKVLKRELLAHIPK